MKCSRLGCRRCRRVCDNGCRDMKLLVIAGGTGGHIFPALTIAEALQKQGVAIEWLGAEVGMERQLVGDRYPIYFLPIKSLRGKSFFSKCSAPFHIIKSILLARRLIKKINPDVVLGMGGYASGPGGVAAWLLKKPLVIHEQNAKAGLTNRLLSRVATTVLQAFPAAFSNTCRAITVGNPVRETIARISPEVKVFNATPKKVLVLGGSQGAQSINHLIVKWLTHYNDPNAFIFWHQTGKRDFDAIQKAYANYPGAIYRAAPFIDDMGEAYAWADVAICRAGALTISELAASGVPGIMIPYPTAADDHQYANALFLANADAGIVVRESALTAEKLSECLHNLVFSPQRLQQVALNAKSCAKPSALDDIIHYCRNAVR